MGSGVKRKLKSVCCGKGWCYGVFWRFDHRNPMLLTVEDAYCEDQMEAVVHAMLLQVHLLGEGSIGQAAFTRKHRWMFSDVHDEECSSSDHTKSQSSLLGDTELHHQFSNGIKTIAVIPVEQRGVLQLGSRKKILENLELLHDLMKPFLITTDVDKLPAFNDDPSCSINDNGSINKLFASLLSTESSFYGNVRLLNAKGNKGFSSSASLPQSSPHMPGIYSGRTSFDQSFSFPALPVKVEPTEAPCISSRTSDISVVTSVASPLPSGMIIRDSCDLDQRDKLKVSLAGSRSSSCSAIMNTINTSGNVVSDFYVQETHNKLLRPLTGQKRPFEEFDAAEDFTDNTCKIDDLSQWFADLPEDTFTAAASTLNYDQPHLAVASTSSSSLVAGDYTFEAPLTINPSPSEEQAANTNCIRGDIFNGLGESVIYQTDGDCWGDNSTYAFPMDWDSSWKGVLAQLGMDDILPNERYAFNSKQHESENFSHSEIMNAVQPARNPTYGRNLQGKEEIFPKSSIGMWIDDSYSNNNRGAVVTRTNKSEEPTKGTKKRARPGESTRPRPKDRQLIQDRLKELRGIIPNGGKCSIDALLDRTIKHMQFLQNVMKYADRLRQANVSKLIKHVKGSSISSVDGGGATWAFEIGSQTMECPVIVEDLDAQGHMLIEMLCEDQGLFLEIANTVRSFGLTILKGEMEVRDGKLWSCFVVEANGRHVRRLDVFWSLMQLLQQKGEDGLKDKVDGHTDAIDARIEILHCNDYKQSLQPLPISLTEMYR